MTDMSTRTPKDFAKSILPLYHGPSVKIRIKSSDHEYTVSKDLLCRESTYFSAMFEDGFKEGQHLQAVLEDMEGIVSVQSLEAFLQWLYLREVRFDLDEPESQISAAIELARFADMCKITGIESYIAKYFKRILVKNPEPERVEIGIYINTYFLTSQHIVSTTFLPRGHTVRRLLAAAMVEQSLLCEDDLISQQIYKYPTFGVDLLDEVRKTLKGMTIGQYVATYKDPLDGTEKKLSRFLGFHYPPI